MSDAGENIFESAQFAERKRWIKYIWALTFFGCFLVGFSDYGKVNTFHGSVADLVTELVEIGGDAAFWTFLGTEENNDLVNHGFLWTQQYLLIGWGEIDDFYVLGWYQEGRKLPQWLFTAYAISAAYFWFWFIWTGLRMNLLEEKLDKDAVERPFSQAFIEELTGVAAFIAVPIGIVWLVFTLF